MEAIGVSSHFSDRSRRAIELAVHEAWDLGHTAVGDAHYLLALLHSRRGVAARALAKHSVRLEPSRAALRAAASRPQGEKPDVFPLELSAKRGLQISLHEAFERNDGPIRAAYLLLGLLKVDGSAAALVRAQGASPGLVMKWANQKLPPPDPSRGRELLENRRDVLEAYLVAAERRDDVTRIVSEAGERSAAAKALESALELSPMQATAVGDMPLDMMTRGMLEAVAAEREDLDRRLRALTA